MPNSIDDVSLADLYLAYRKAKAEAYYETSHFHALGFLEYEKNLDKNLRQLANRLSVEEFHWPDAGSVGGFGFLPKSVELRSEASSSDGVFFRCLDPIEEWHRHWSNEHRAKAKFRLVICPTVEFQVFSALWIIRVGHKFDQILNPDLSFGHRLRRTHDEEITDFFEPQKKVNLDCIGLFAPYFAAYREWRARGLKTMQDRLEHGDRVFAVTMDIQSFYHRVSADFLLGDSFLKRFSISLSPFEFRLTSILVSAIRMWYASTPDAMDRPSGGLPVGLSASKIIANVLLAELDERVVSELTPFYYGRYVDDIFLVLEGDPAIQSGTDMMQWLAASLDGLLTFEPASELTNEQLRLEVSYAPDADLVFAGHKQKVFNLVGLHGLDLVSHIGEQIRIHSSEHRLLSTVPATGEEMAARTLLAQSNAALESDALRKADVVSVRRLG